ncbi:glycoside hydrolase family 16 protein [Candidatus Berkelbacteria bacterium]|nr:glycoside hydrolase family 16 protein [Candidatus Berkelbacteria bacterium]
MLRKIIFLVVAMMIMAFIGYQQNIEPLPAGAAKDTEELSDPSKDVISLSVKAQITYFSPASGTYYPSNAVTSYLRFKNTGTERWTFWVGYSVQDKAGRWYDTPSHSVTLDPGKESSTQSKTWYVLTDPLLTTGYYKVAMAVWKTRPENGGATRLDYKERSNAFQAFNFLDSFSSFNTSRWYRGAHNLGLGYLDPSNVGVSAGSLTLKFPSNTYNGAEIGSNNRYKYGTYRVRMKNPQAPGSLSTFFLYQGVSGGNDEIDIEIYNNGTRRIDFVTWVRGTRTNHAQHTLAFDPSAAYHEYRIDFYPNNVSFYVDGQLLRTWTSGLPTNSMRLMSNAWWPTWLSGPKPTTHKYTYIDWIQH